MEQKKVDVIIPTYKPDKQFLKLLDKLGRQTVKINCIFVLNTEQKYFDELVCGVNFQEKYNNVKVIHLTKAEFDHGGTRRMGMKQSLADYVVCMTQDAMPADEMLIEELLKPFDEKSVACTYARQLPTEDASLIEQFTRSYNYPDKSLTKEKKDIPVYGIKTYMCSNVCAAYNREIYEKQGGFTEHTIFNEDMIYAAGAVNAGYKIVYAASARVIHSHNYNCVQQYKRNFDLGVSQAKFPEIFASVPSESEGIRMVKKTAVFLLKRGRWYLLPKLVLLSAGKYLGYRAGKSYKKFDKKGILKRTSNAGYWQMEWEKAEQ